MSLLEEKKGKMFLPKTEKGKMSLSKTERGRTTSMCREEKSDDFVKDASTRTILMEEVLLCTRTFGGGLTDIGGRVYELGAHDPEGLGHAGCRHPAWQRARS
mmetsp:Transcript_80443/g.204522  ORF Transcript_80443/g.204522 Transcript_80443/m.204522 type:complete len:102 (+) Transcript_80443:168-473(+)